MGHSFCLWGTSLSSVLVHVHRAGLSSVQQQIHVLVTIACSMSLTRTPPSVLPSSAFLPTRSKVPISPARCGALCSCSLDSDLLRARLDQLSCQAAAAAGNPDGLLVTVQVWQAEPVPAHDGPVPVRVLQLRLSCKHTHTQGGFTTYSFTSASLPSFHFCPSALTHQCFPSEIFHRSRPDSRNAARARTPPSPLLGSVLLRPPDRRGASECRQRGTKT